MSRGWQVAFAVASLALAAVVLTGLVQEARRPHKRIQRQLAAARGEDAPGVIEVDGPFGSERCLTCHFDLIAERAPADHPAVFVEHPPYVVGCVGCHGGDGRSLDPEWAHSPTGPDRLVATAWRSARCALCHVPGSVDDQGLVVRGIAMFEEVGCHVCHRAGDLIAPADRQGGFGPDLDDAGRLDPATLRSMVLDPVAYFGVDTKMPPFTEISDRPEILEPLIAYLTTLRVSAPPVRALGDAGQACVGCHAATPARGLQRHRCSFILQRRQELACARCHAGGDTGGLQLGGDGHCPFVDGMRPVCGACHRMGGDTGSGGPHGR